MKIADHEVSDVTKESAQVGCSKVYREELEDLLKLMDEAPMQEFPRGKLHNITDTSKLIKLCRDKFDYCFMELRDSGDFKEKGFYLDDQDGWTIVKDDEDAFVLVREEDITDKSYMSE